MKVKRMDKSVYSSEAEFGSCLVLVIHITLTTSLNSYCEISGWFPEKTKSKRLNIPCFKASFTFQEQISKK